MTDIDSLRFVTDTQKQKLKSEVRTLNDLWTYVGKDYDRGIDNLANAVGMKREELLDILGNQAIREVEQHRESWFRQHWRRLVIFLGLAPLALGLLFVRMHLAQILGGITATPVRVSLIIGLVIIGVIAAWVLIKPFKQVPTSIRVLNSNGDKGTALVIYHPGTNDYPYRVSFAFANGLASSRWRTELVAASNVAPADVSMYDLLVLVSPSAYRLWLPRAMRQYLKKRLDDLEGKDTAIILASESKRERPLGTLNKLVEAKHGSIIKALACATEQQAKDAGESVWRSFFPIRGYDTLNRDEVIEELNGLSEIDLKKVRSYEKKHKNRLTVLEPLNRKIIESSS